MVGPDDATARLAFGYIARTAASQAPQRGAKKRRIRTRGSLAKSGGESLRPLIEILRGFVERGGPHDASGCPIFSKAQRARLRELLPSDEAVLVIEAQCALANFRDAADFAQSARNVRHLVRRNGVKLPRGKRPLAYRIALVEEVVPIILWYGVPFASGTDSPLVQILRAVAKALGFVHDPRVQLRGLVDKERRLEAAQRQATEALLSNFRAAIARLTTTSRDHDDC